MTTFSGSWSTDGTYKHFWYFPACRLVNNDAERKLKTQKKKTVNRKYCVALAKIAENMQF